MLRGVLVRIVFVAGVLALLIGRVSAPVAAQDAPTFALPGNERLQTLSPDGSLIAATTPGGADLCVFTVPDAEEVACVNLNDQRIRLDPVSINWSPDSSALVFSEHSFQFLIDSDVWMLKIETASLTNLTDDGVVGGLPLIADEPLDHPFLVDLVPAWSPDGATIAFSRFVHPGEGDTPTSLMLLDVASGEVTELAVFTETGPWGLPYKLEWSASGNVIFASGFSPDPSGDLNGVWAFDAERGDISKLAGASDAFNGAAPALTAVSPSGDALVINYPNFIKNQRTPDGGSGYALLDLISGDITPIEPADDYAGDYSVVVGPNFSPDGSALIFGVRQPSEEAGFIIARDIVTGDEMVLAELPAGVFPIASDPRVPVQIGGGIAMALTDPSTGVLVELPEELNDAPVSAATPEANDPEVAATPDTDGDEGESAQTTDTEVATLTVTIAENAAVLREGPSGDDDIIVILQPGTELTPLGEAFESDGHFWIEVEVIETGETGFVRTDFLEPVG
jgi:hypothetical protein